MHNTLNAIVLAIWFDHTYVVTWLVIFLHDTWTIIFMWVHCHCHFILMCEYLRYPFYITIVIIINHVILYWDYCTTIFFFIVVIIWYFVLCRSLVLINIIHVGLSSLSFLYFIVIILNYVILCDYCHCLLLFIALNINNVILCGFWAISNIISCGITAIILFKFYHDYHKSRYFTLGLLLLSFF